MQFDTASQNNCEELVKLLVHHCKKIDPGIWYISPGIKLRSDIEVSGGLGSQDIPLIIEDEGE